MTYLETIENQKKKRNLKYIQCANCKFGNTCSIFNYNIEDCNNYKLYNKPNNYYKSIASYNSNELKLTKDKVYNIKSDGIDNYILIDGSYIKLPNIVFNYYFKIKNNKTL